MKRTMVFGALFSFLVAMGYGNVAMSGGIEPGAGEEDCSCIPQPGSPDWKKLNIEESPFLKGVFTVSNDPCSVSFPECLEGKFMVHLSLNRVNSLHLHVKTFQTGNRGACSPCLIKEDEIEKLAYDLSCFLQVEKPFGLVGTPVIKELKITARNCGDGDPNKHILMGEVIIAVVPTLKCSPP